MKKRLIELGVVVVILGIAILIIPASYSKYESKGGSEAEIQYAFYLLKADYFTKNIKLMDIVPRNDSYEYVFTVSNFDGDKRLETDLEYDVWISATTNLPLDYKLYLNDNLTNDIICDDKVEADNYGTFFRTMKTDKMRFSFKNNETNTYHLFISFPEMYNDSVYADLVENIAINIESRQVTE